MAREGGGPGGRGSSTATSNRGQSWIAPLINPYDSTRCHVRLFFVQNFIAFYSSKDGAKCVLPFSEINKIEKKKTLELFPNAVQLSTADGQTHFFSSFVERDQVVPMSLPLSQAFTHVKCRVVKLRAHVHFVRNFVRKRGAMSIGVKGLPRCGAGNGFHGEMGCAGRYWLKNSANRTN